MVCNTLFMESNVFCSDGTEENLKFTNMDKMESVAIGILILPQFIKQEVNIG